MRRFEWSPGSVLLVALAIVVALRLLLVPLVPAPFVFIDELVYMKLAQSFYEVRSFLLWGVYTPFPSVLYPVLIAPLQALGDPARVHALTLAFNGLLMTSAAWPIYLLGRRYTSAAGAAAVALLSVVAPYALFGHLVMAESLFFALAMWSSFLAMLALSERKRWQQLGLALALGLAFHTKLHAVVLPVGVGAALVSLAWARGGQAGWRYALGFWPLGVGYGGFLGLHIVRMTWLAPTAPAGADAVVGGYAAALNSVPAPATAVATSLLAHLGALAFGLGFLPLVLAAAYWGHALSRGEAADKALAAFTLGAGGLMLAVSAKLATDSGATGVIIERYGFFLVPLVGIAALAAAERGRVRWRLSVALAFGLIGLTLALAPAGPSPDAPNFAALYRPALSVGWPAALAIAGAGSAFYALALGFSLATRRRRLALGLALAFTLGLSGFSFVAQSALSHRYAMNRPYGEWLQAHAGPSTPIAFLDDDLPGMDFMLANFYAPQPVRAYYLMRPTALTWEPRVVPGADGELAALSALPDGALIVAHRQTPLALEVIDRRDTSVLYRKSGRVRLFR